MKRLWIFFLCLGLLAACDESGRTKEHESKKIELKTENQRLSYSLGLIAGENYKKQSIEVDMEYATRGLKDGLSGEGILTREEIQQVMMDFYKRRKPPKKNESTATETKSPVPRKNAFNTKEIRDKNLKEGQAFLAENMKKEGVVTLPSGLQYKVIREGHGEPPKIDDTITLHYRGMLLSGKEFDSSYSKGKAAKFKVSQGIPGWIEALRLMKTGAEWKLFVPANLAYGEGGSGHGMVVEPNSVLLFDMQLLFIEPTP